MKARTVTGLRERYGDPLLTALTILVALMIFLAAPLQSVFGGGFTWFGVTIALIMVAGVFTLSGSVLAAVLMVVAFGMNIAAILLRMAGQASALNLYLVALAWLVVSITLGAVVARSTFAAGVVTYHRILGAILLYLLVGLVFVAIFTLLALQQPHAFSGVDARDDPGFTGALIYFSFVTLTSVGYGDIAPLHPFARSLCNLEAICGQLYPAILIGRLVSLQLTKA